MVDKKKSDFVKKIMGSIEGKIKIIEEKCTECETNRKLAAVGYDSGRVDAYRDAIDGLKGVLEEIKLEEERLDKRWFSRLLFEKLRKDGFLE